MNSFNIIRIDWFETVIAELIGICMYECIMCPIKSNIIMYKPA